MNKPSGHWIIRNGVWHADVEGSSWSALCGWHYGREYFIKICTTKGWWFSGGPPSPKCKECVRLLTAYQVAEKMEVL